jgi:hypothetical protein
MERSDAARVAFDGDHRGTLRQQGARQSAGARSDLDRGAVGQVAGGARDAGGQVEVEQEVLAERLARGKAVPRDDVAQRRQGGSGRLVQARTRCARCARWRAIVPASLIASIRLAGLATPLPAMFSAVP